MGCSFFVRSLAVVLLTVALTARGASPQLQIETGVELKWPTTAGNTYRLQWSAAPGGPWGNLQAVSAGDGTTNSFYDPAAQGTRYYQVVEIVPGSGAGGGIPVNGGFELGNGTTATNWSTSAGQPPARSSAMAHSGAFSMHSALTNTTAASSEGMVSQLVAAQGGTVTAGQTYDFSFWARQVSAGASYVQQYQVQWRNAANASVGGTGLVNFKAVNGSWTNIIVKGLTAPADAVDVRILFRCVTGAVNGDHGEVFIDDVVLQRAGGPSGPGQTNVLQVAIRPMAKVSWLSEAGVDYQPITRTNLAPGSRTNSLAIVPGDGGIKSVMIPILQEAEFIQVRSPKLVIGPPTNLRIIASGLTNAIGLAWNGSPTAGVLGYRILYGLEPIPLERKVA